MSTTPLLLSSGSALSLSLAGQGLLTRPVTMSAQNKSDVHNPRRKYDEPRSQRTFTQEPTESMTNSECNHAAATTANVGSHGPCDDHNPHEDDRQAGGTAYGRNRRNPRPRPSESEEPTTMETPAILSPSSKP